MNGSGTRDSGPGIRGVPVRQTEAAGNRGGSVAEVPQTRGLKTPGSMEAGSLDPAFGRGQMETARTGPAAAVGATVWYAVITLLMTWPLATGLARDIPWDLGDSVLNCWILQWGADHWLRFLGGDLGAFRGYFNANIFYPEPLTIAYSEHMTAQVVQILPVYALTHNIVLAYNLLFLSTFVLSGLGAYLLVRELTGSARAGFVAGLLYAFAPYRIGEFSHLQVLSSQWMPFALYAFRRYFESRRLWSLAGAALALVAQNLSCGYFLVYFAPFVAAYVIYEIASRGRWRDVRMWGELGAAAVAVAAVTVPLLLPYMALRERGFGPRPFEEVTHYSADVYSYLTAHGAQFFWGAIMRAFPKSEGDLFPSVVPVLLAVIGVVAHARVTWAVTRSRGADPAPPLWRRALIYGAAAVLAWQAWSVVIILARNGIDWQLGSLVLRVHNLARALRSAALAAVVLAVFSPRARSFMRGVPTSAVAFYVAAALAAFWLSFGPIIYSKGLRVAGDGLYWWLYLNVPGVDSLRVPARMGMLVALFLAVLGGYGARAIERMFRPFDSPARGALAPFDSAQGRQGKEAPRLRREDEATASRGPDDAPEAPRLQTHTDAGSRLRSRGAIAPRAGRRQRRMLDRSAIILAAASVLFLVESTPAPIELNRTWSVGGLKAAPVPVIAADGPPAIYRAVRALPAQAVLVEFPFGEEQYELRYMLYSAEHWRPLLNGYSGGFPLSYAVNRAGLGRVLEDPDTAWRVLATSGATHAIVHEDIYLDGNGARVSSWLRAHGSRQVAASDEDVLFELPPPGVARNYSPLHEM